MVKKIQSKTPKVKPAKISPSNIVTGGVRSQ